MLRVLSMMATSLAIAPATATCGSGTIASLAFMTLNLLPVGWGSSAIARPSEHVARSPIAVLGVLMHSIDPEGGAALDPGPDVEQRGPPRLRPPARQLGRGGR